LSTDVEKRSILDMPENLAWLLLLDALTVRPAEWRPTPKAAREKARTVAYATPKADRLSGQARRRDPCSGVSSRSRFLRFYKFGNRRCRSAGPARTGRRPARPPRP